MKQFDLDSVVEANEFPRVKPGGYICQITAVNDVPNQEYLKIEYDIAEGDLKDYYFNLYKTKGFWGGSFIRSYKDTAKPFFKAFITAVERSNKGYQWDFDESKLKKKFIGLILGEEEYQGNDGVTKKRIYVAQVHSVEKIRKGDFKIPELKKEKLQTAGKGTVPDGFHPIGDTIEEDLPF